MSIKMIIFFPNISANLQKRRVQNAFRHTSAIVSQNALKYSLTACLLSARSTGLRRIIRIERNCRIMQVYISSRQQLRQYKRLVVANPAMPVDHNHGLHQTILTFRTGHALPGVVRFHIRQAALLFKDSLLPGLLTNRFLSAV